VIISALARGGQYRKCGASDATGAVLGIREDLRHVLFPIPRRGMVTPATFA
jgi:hypothetical protein